MNLAKTLELMDQGNVRVTFLVTNGRIFIRARTPGGMADCSLALETIKLDGNRPFTEALREIVTEAIDSEHL